MRQTTRYCPGRQIVVDTGLAIDTGLARCAGHQPSGERSLERPLRRQRTVNPLIVPARYNFLYASSRPALRAAACGGRPRPAASPTGQRGVASPPWTCRRSRPRLLDPDSCVQRHPGRLRLGRCHHGARAQPGWRCSVRRVGSIQPGRVGCDLLAQVTAAVELRRSLPRVRLDACQRGKWSSWTGLTLRLSL